MVSIFDGIEESLCFSQPVNHPPFPQGLKEGFGQFALYLSASLGLRAFLKSACLTPDRGERGDSAHAIYDNSATFAADLKGSRSI